MHRVMRLLQFTDSQFPVGTFSFSNGLETASFEKIVTDANSLESFARSQSHQAAFSDGVACLHAFRAYKSGEYDKIKEIDKYLYAFKMNDESRLMGTRMGKKLAELGVKLYDDDFVKQWLKDINKGETPGMYPVSQGIMFALAGISEDLLKDSGLDFSVLLPLMRQTVKKLEKLSPSQAQTGPAVRKDKGIISTHLQMLENKPEIKRLYHDITNLIYEKSKI